jgi:O-antigen/teichoic acid export membrane protein
LAVQIHDLKRKAIRGGLAKLLGQGANFALRLGFIVTLARFLDPADFGLVAMVTAVTGIFPIFTSTGLSSAAVRQEHVTDEQMSGLFWFNILAGAALGILSVAIAPLLCYFYQEPRLFWIMVATSAGLVISAAGVQHNTLLQRHLRYDELTAIEVLSQLLGIAVGISMAISGFAYWALVGWTIVVQTTGTVLLWLTADWIPSRPRRRTGIRPLLRFGGTLTLNILVVHIAYNFEKVLLGRFWGAEALGIYGRAYQLVNLPTDNLNSAVGGVAFSALSRLQNDLTRLKSYFINGYSLLISLTIPLSLYVIIFADDLVMVVLGEKWTEVAPILRLLAPIIFVFGIINPLGWLLYSIGLQGRSLRIAVVIAPIVITAYVIGLPYGPKGVALAYSVAMALWMMPHLIWCTHKTIISPKDLVRSMIRPCGAAIIAAAGTYGLVHYFDEPSSPLVRLIAGGGVMLPGYLFLLLFVFGQIKFYYNLLIELKGRSSEIPDWPLAADAESVRR